MVMRFRLASLLATLALIASTGFSPATARAGQPELPSPTTEPADSLPKAENENESLPYKTIGDIALSQSPPTGRLPLDHSKDLFRNPKKSDLSGPTSQRASLSYHWVAARTWHQPLYFDNIPLERYGQSNHPRLQPLISGVRFFGTLPVIPYKIGIDRTHDRISTLGLHRPGSPTPGTRQRLPWEWDAAAFESGAWIGLLLLLP